MGVRFNSLHPPFPIIHFSPIKRTVVWWFVVMRGCVAARRPTSEVQLTNPKGHKRNVTYFLLIYGIDKIVVFCMF